MTRFVVGNISGRLKRCINSLVSLLEPNRRTAANSSTGPIVRISPTEVHVNDPEFIDQLFAGSGKRREKGQLTLNGLGTTPTAIGTRDHSLHKSRRAALNPFFSTAKIRRLEPMVHEVLYQIFQRLDEHRRADMPVNLNLLYRAATHDLIADYAFGQGFVCFSRSDLNQPYFDAYHQMVMNWHFGTYFPWVGRLFRRLPPSIVKKVMPTVLPFINMIEVCSHHDSLYYCANYALGCNRKD